jgi:hypothetical protein
MKPKLNVRTIGITVIIVSLVIIMLTQHALGDTLDNKIDRTIVELVKENQTNSFTTTYLMGQLIYLYKEKYDCSESTTVTLEDSCTVSVSHGDNEVSITLTFPLAENYGRNVTQ